MNLKIKQIYYLKCPNYLRWIVCLKIIFFMKNVIILGKLHGDTKTYHDTLVEKPWIRDKPVWITLYYWNYNYERTRALVCRALNESKGINASIKKNNVWESLLN